MATLYKRATETIRKMVGYREERIEPDYNALLEQHPIFARKVLDALFREARDIARLGNPLKTPEAPFKKIYRTAEVAGIPTEEIDPKVVEIGDLYDMARMERLQLAETQHIDVRELIGEAEPVTA